MVEKDFVVFGCWNKGDATRDNHFSQVVERIKINEHESPSRIYVAGDNYYPLKERVVILDEEEQEGKSKKVKKKYYNSEDLESGFTKLKELKPKSGKIDILLGNHDLEEIKKDMYYAKTNIKLGVGEECAISEQQNSIITSHLNFSWAEPITKFGNHTIIVCITSVFYTEDADDMLKCFEELGKSLADEVYEIKRGLKKYSSNKNIKNIVVIGHEPIAPLRDLRKMDKYEEKKNVRIPVFTEEGRKLLYEIYMKFPKAKNYYICADVHNFQQNTITMAGPIRHSTGTNTSSLENNSPIIIHEFVVGTGGAKLDECPIVGDYTERDTNTNGANYSIKTKNKICSQNHGYLYVIDLGEALGIEFYDIVGERILNSLDVKKKERGKTKKRRTGKKKKKKGRTRRRRRKMKKRKT